jgi:hypothetical protein
VRRVSDHHFNYDYPIEMPQGRNSFVLLFYRVPRLATNSLVSLYSITMLILLVQIVIFVHSCDVYSVTGFLCFPLHCLFSYIYPQFLALLLFLRKPQSNDFREQSYNPNLEKTTTTTTTMQFTTITSASLLVASLTLALPTTLEPRLSILDKGNWLSGYPPHWIQFFSGKSFTGDDMYSYSDGFCVDLFSGDHNPADKAFDDRIMSAKLSHHTTCRLFPSPFCSEKEGFCDISRAYTDLSASPYGDPTLPLPANSISSFICSTAQE